MKKQKSILIALPLLLAMLFVSLAPFAVVPAKADDDNQDLIYYFSDYYPTLDVATLNENFPDYGVVYHHQWATETTLYNAVMQGVPSGVTFHTVIIDIKSFVPSGATMSAIFSYFASQGCRTVFVSQYEPGDFDNDNFFDLVDHYCHSNLSTLNFFIYWALDDMFERNGDTLANTTILIDGRLIDPFYSNTQDGLSGRFPFYEQLNIVQGNQDFNSPSNVHHLVHYGIDFFYDVPFNASSVSYDVPDINDFTDAQENRIWEYICSIGFSRLDTNFSSFIGNNRSSFYELPTYLLGAEPLEYDEEGMEALAFTTADAIAMEADNSVEVTEVRELLTILSSVLT